MLENNYPNEYDKYYDELEFDSIFKSIIRSKIFIISFSSFVTISTFLFTSNLKPTFKGNFEIIAKKNDENNLLTNNLPSNPLINNLIANDVNDKKTRELILKSPFILKPVFEFAKKEYLNRGEKKEDLTYEAWLSKSVQINFEKGSNVLRFNFKDKDKSLISEVLKKTLKKYQDYSRRDRIKALTNGISYLEKQEVSLKKKSLVALKELNEFTILNGLRDLYITPNYKQGGSLKADDNLQESLDDQSITNRSVVERFESLFMQLEAYEKQYIEYSLYLKPNSYVLKELKQKINNLKESLKRPNSILIEYKELVKSTTQIEKLLTTVQNQLRLYKLQIAKQEDPWLLISGPTVLDSQVSPKVLKTSFLAFLVSIILASTIALFKEKKSGLLFEKDIIKKLLNCKYLESLSIKEEIVNNKIIDLIIKKELSKKLLSVDERLGIIDLSANKKNNVSKLMINYKNYTYIKPEDELNFTSLLGLFIIIRSGQITKEEIKWLNKYIKINNEKIIGWFFLDK